jgi:hypothetical protein
MASTVRVGSICDGGRPEWSHLANKRGELSDVFRADERPPFDFYRKTDIDAAGTRANEKLTTFLELEAAVYRK